MKRQMGLLTVCGLLLLSAAGRADELEVVYPRLLMINFDPVLESQGDARLHSWGGWNSPSYLTFFYLNDFEEASHGLVQGRLTRWINADVYPLKSDGFRYTDEVYIPCRLTWSGWHQPDGVDYRAIARDYDLARKVDSGEIDEVLIHGAPYFGYWESTMAGLGGYWCNSGPQQRIACSKIFVMMGFNYERGVAEMIHSYGHRAESIMSEVYDGWNVNGDRTIWDRFGWNIGQTSISSVYGIGSVHLPPNGDDHYDYANPQTVTSYAPDWMDNFPDFTGATASVSRNTWGASGGWDWHRNFLKWWYAHMPHIAGRNNHDGYDRLNNWWAYLQNFNEYAESGGSHLPGGEAPAAEPNPIPPTPVTVDERDDWAPKVNASGRLVWHGADGDDFEIYSSESDGSDLVQITQNEHSDEDPQINAAGQLVWQRFDGQDYEIFTANADGSAVVQITNNAVDDWHPDINDLGRIVWDSFDGLDYEIHSANVDGTDLVQITDNGAAFPQRPREDVWPQINNSNRVVWFGFDGNDWEIFSANHDGSNLVNVSNDFHEDVYPQLNNSGRVVWFRYLSDSSSDIYSADATGGGVVRVTDNSWHDWHPQISDNGTVVWMSRPVLDWEVFSANALDGSLTTQISDNTNHDQYPQIDASGRIVWQGFDGLDWEIYGWDADTVYQITDNDFDDRAPRMNDSARIAWHSNSAAGAVSDSTEIFSAPLGMNLPDGDEDGLPDDWEVQKFGDLTHVGEADEEPDGLTNLEEFENNTDPLDADSDDDGLSDGEEVHVFESDPNDGDSDDDGLGDAAEVAAGTDPGDPDSDDDTIPDGWEVDRGLDPLTDDADGDPDNDGFRNREEFEADSDPLAPWSTPLPPPVGSGLEFDGVDDFVDLGDVAVSGAALTVEAWVQPQTTSSARILEKLEDYGIQFTGNNVVRFLTKHGFTWDYLDGETENDAGQWVHVACTLDGSLKTVYVNGERDGQKPYDYDVRVTSNNLILGANSPSASQGFLAALMDDVRVWNVARSQAEIQAAMNSALTGGEPGLLGYWDFEEGSGQTVFDLAGGHDGRLGTDSAPDDSDPAWIDSEVALSPMAGEGPAISDVVYPASVASDSVAVVTATISDADTGGDGVADATLYYAFDWPFNDYEVAGAGPGGSGDGTWSFSVPALGASGHGERLWFFLRGADGAGNPTYATNDEALYSILIGTLADSDEDGDVDLDDQAAFHGCLTGPGGSPPGPGCDLFDFGIDDDVDLRDFAEFQQAFTASGP